MSPRRFPGASTGWALAVLLVLVPAIPAAARPLAILLREGRHPGFVRLVLDLPPGASAVLAPDGTLLARARDGTALPLAAPAARRALLAADASGQGLRVALPPGARVRAWRLGPRFVFDVSAAAHADHANPAPLPVPPMPPTAAPPTAATEQPAQPPPTRPTPTRQAVTPHLATDPRPPVATTALAPAHRDIALPYAADTPIAAFRRGGHFLLVAATRAPPLPAVLAQLGATAMPLPAGMLLTMPPGLVPSAENGAWHLVERASAPAIAPRAGHGQVALPAAAPGPVLSLRDPLHGGLLLVGTVAAPGGVAVPWRTPFFTLLPSATGVAVAAHADAVQLRALATGFQLDGGPVALPLGSYDAAAAATIGARLLDLPDRPLADLRRRLTDATLAAATAPPLARGAARLRAAEAMLALGMGSEAGAVLHLAGNDDARLAADPRFRLAEAAAAALHGDPPADPATLSTEPCAAADEACLWRAVRLAAAPTDRATAAGMFASVLPILDAYPAPLRARLLPLAAETMLAAGQSAAARALLAAHPQAPALRLARAIALEVALPPPAAGVGGRDPAARALAAALAAYDRLAVDRDRLVAFRAAFRAARLRAVRGLATPAETEAALDRLRDAWRGDARALALREALAEARAESGQWDRALALLRRQKRDPDIKQKLATMFARAIAADAAHPMLPLQFVSLVQSNPDLLPPGAPGEAILRRLASRLVALDLPHQAARVYARMLDAMPPGVSRAKVGAELAAQRLAAGDARGARAALDASATVGPQPPDLLQRRTMLFARAAARLGDMPAAAASLAALGSVPALALRARLLERAGDWPAASAALRDYAAATVPKTGKLDVAATATLLRLATAAGRAGDAALLTALRAHDLARMPPGHAADLFRMLTDPAALSLSDLPRVSRTWGLPDGIAPALRAAGARLVVPPID